MSDLAETDELYIPYKDQKQATHKISKNVVYLGHFGAFGTIMPAWQRWYWERSQTPKTSQGKCMYRSQAFAEMALDSALKDLKDCVVLSTTPTYWSQYSNACLLKSRGFKLVSGKCYLHPSYSGNSNYTPEHPGIPDRKQHWEHIWYKLIGTPKELGVPGAESGQSVSVANCGIDVVQDPTAHMLNKRNRYLAVAWLKRGVAFPKGWRRFHSAEDFKLGVNFDDIASKSKVQECPHNFDLKVFEGWQPDFARWSPE